MTTHTTLAKRRATLLQAAAQVSKNITSILQPEYLLKQTVDVICDEFGFYYAGVFLIDETGQWAELQAGRGKAGAAMLAEEHKLKVGGHSMIGAAMGRRKAFIALDVGEEPTHFRNPRLPDTRSEMALPLIVGHTLIGALTVQSVQEAAFSEDDITALQTMADQLAIAINNARLHTQNEQLLAQTERHARMLEAAAEVGRGVTSILDLDELLNKTVDIICDTYDFYYAGVFLVDETGEWVVLRAGRGEAGAAMIAEGHKLKAGGLSMIGAAIDQRQALIALDVGDEPVHFRNPHLPDTRSEMALPLTAGKAVIGALTVQSIKEAAFNEDDITTLQTMADQLAIAINNARLLRELKAAHAELVRTKTFEAIATATTEAIHWIGNKALPISNSVKRLQDDLAKLPQTDPELLTSLQEDLELIQNSVRLILSVKRHLIGPAREEMPRPAMLDDVIKDRAVMLGIPAEVISYTVAPDLPLALADTTQLSRAFCYVLKNAMEAMEGTAPQHIRVRVAPTADASYVAVHIVDTGPGIPQEEMDKIWATFYTTKGANHAGLGLPASSQILKQLDGSISATNVPGGGAAFELLLPLFEGTLPNADLPTGRAILLIDDDDAWSDFVEKTLREAGNTVTRSADGHIDPAAFDLILLDDVLETANSLKVLRQLKTTGASGKTIVVASSLWVERAMELMKSGVQDVLIKPYTPASLAKIVN